MSKSKTIQKTDLNGDSNVNTTSKIEAIKQIIFGEDIKAYNSEFESVKKEILAKKQELEDLIDQVKLELSKSIDDLSTDINIRITDIEEILSEKTENLTQNKVDKKALSELFISIGEKLSK